MRITCFVVTICVLRTIGSPSRWKVVSAHPQRMFVTLFGHGTNGRVNVSAWISVFPDMPNEEHPWCKLPSRLIPIHFFSQTLMRGILFWQINILPITKRNGIRSTKSTLIRIKPTWNHPGNVSLISPATLQTGTVNRKRKAFRLPCGRLKCHKSKRLNIFLQNEPVLTTS